VTATTTNASRHDDTIATRPISGANDSRPVSVIRPTNSSAESGIGSRGGMRNNAARCRRTGLAGVSSQLTGAWAVQQARNLAMDLGRRIETFKFLIHDRDPIFTRAFNEVFEAEDLKIIRTAAHAPRRSAYGERVIDTLRRELLDKVLIVNEWHLTTVLTEYLIHYNGHRPHGPASSDRPRSMSSQPSRPSLSPTCHPSAENRPSPA
jgi:putative transposase